MRSNPVFSIITITLNNEEGLNRTADSIKIQSFQDIEWVVVDGDSQDGTKAFLRDSEAFWTSEPDQGLYDAMNKGIAQARGEYLMFLNAGDALESANTIERIKDALHGQPTRPDFIYGDSREGTARAFKPARTPATIGWGMFTHHQAMLYRREALGALRYDLNYKIAADYDFTLRFLKNAKGILYWPFPVCVFETGGISQKKARQGRREQFAIRRKLRMSALKNFVAYIAQSAVWKFRAFMPRAYWRLKSSGRKSSYSSRSGFSRT